MSWQPPRLLWSVGWCAGMWRAEGLRPGAARVRRGHGGGREGTTLSRKGPAQFVSLIQTHSWPCAKCLLTTTQKIITLCLGRGA